MSFEKYTMIQNVPSCLKLTIGEAFTLWLNKSVLKALQVKEGDCIGLLFDKEQKKVGIVWSDIGYIVRIRGSKGAQLSISSFFRKYKIRRGQRNLPIIMETYEGKPCATVIVETIND